MRFEIISILVSICISSFLFYSVAGTECPDYNSTSPCTCTEPPVAVVRCEGDLITQEAIQETIWAIREHNSLLDDEWLSIERFELSRTQMEQVDLTPFLNVSARIFSFLSNSQLTTIVGPGLEYEGSIDIEHLVTLSYNEKLTDEGLGDTLKYFKPTLNWLYLSDNALTGFSAIESSTKAELELFPGLSQFTTLKYLDLSGNQITRLDGGKLSKHINLTSLFLGRNPNLIVEENAFLFDETPSTDSLFLTLSSCNLNDSLINIQGSGLMELSRGVQVQLDSNKFDFISAEKFEMFLIANDNNKISLEANPLICDQRMKWLHDQKDIFISKVYFPFCSNDPGYTVFTTSLIT